MHREGDLIFFDETDRNRFEGLQEEWLPIELVPELFQNVLDAQLVCTAEIQKLVGHDSMDRSYAECLVELQEAHLRAHRLQVVAKGLVELAGPELIDSMLPVGA